VLERVELYPPTASFALRRRLRSSAGQAKRHAIRWLRGDAAPGPRVPGEGEF